MDKTESKTSITRKRLNSKEKFNQALKHVTDAVTLLKDEAVQSDNFDLAKKCSEVLKTLATGEMPLVSIAELWKEDKA